MRQGANSAPRAQSTVPTACVSGSLVAVEGLERLERMHSLSECPTRSRQAFSLWHSLLESKFEVAVVCDHGTVRIGAAEFAPRISNPETISIDFDGAAVQCALQWHWLL